MKLILTLSLICTLTSAVDALRCYHNGGGMHTCPADEVCATYSARSGLVNQEQQFHVTRACLPSTLCLKQNEVLSARYEVDVNVVLQCCDTDGCNDHDGGQYSLQQEKENGLECFSCAGPLGMPCTKTVKCLGIQNRCVTTTMHHHDDTTITQIRGCASANVCETLSNFKSKYQHFMGVSKFYVKKCCGSSFCNSAWTVKMNFGALLLCLIVFVVY